MQMVIKVKSSASRACVYDLARKPRFRAERVDHVNFILEVNLFQNKIHSVIT